MDNLAFLDATAQADLVRKGEVTPLELTEAAIGRLERLNPTLNAVVTPLYEQGRAAAAGPVPDGPFRGVPTLLKDLGAALAGVPLTGGCRWMKEYAPPYDSVAVTRMKQAGLIFLGKSNTPEFGLLPTTEPRLFGPTRNPWDMTRTAGGSSGGAAAAVAAGLVPVAHASDGGGSIRIPASHCGLFGLKPSRGRVSMAPLGDTLGLSAWHAVTRSVRDSAALLDVMAGPVPGDPYYAPAPSRPFLAEVGAAPGRLRIAFTTTAPGGAPVHPEVAAAVRATAALCESLGHEVTEAAPTLDFPTASRAFLTLWYAGVAVNVDGFLPLLKRAPGPEDLEPLTQALLDEGRRITASQHLMAVMALQAAGRRIAAFLTQYDLWLTPVMTQPPLPLGAFDSTEADPLQGMRLAEETCPFTPLINAAGLPAMSVPLHWTPEGLPVGAHFVARFGEEATLLRLAAQLEEARPWAGRRPPVHA